MATRFYLPASGTPPLPDAVVDGQWEMSNVERLPMYTFHSGTALTTRTVAWGVVSGSKDWCWWQFQSPPLAKPVTFTQSDTFRGVVGKCAETTTNGNSFLVSLLKVVSGDGTLKAVLHPSLLSGGPEFDVVAAASTRLQATTNLLLAYTASVGDYLIIEVGPRGASPANENVQLRTGDPTGVADFAFTASLTTDLVPWFEVSADVDFGETNFDCHWVDSVALGTSLTLKPEQSLPVTLTVAAGQIIPIKSKLYGSTAVSVGLPR